MSSASTLRDGKEEINDHAQRLTSNNARFCTSIKIVKKTEGKPSATSLLIFRRNENDSCLVNLVSIKGLKTLSKYMVVLSLGFAVLNSSWLY